MSTRTQTIARETRHRNPVPADRWPVGPFGWAAVFVAPFWLAVGVGLAVFWIA